MSNAGERDNKSRESDSPSKEADFYPELEEPVIRKEKMLLFEELWNWVEKDVNRTVVLKGWNTKERRDGEYIALIHSEVSECLEALRTGNQLSEKTMLNVNGVTCAEEELADALIRILDFAHMRKYNIPKALFIKMEYNKQRPYRHGGKLF